ncbi:MAG TPA: helix-turn-helix transcriptional regulator [Terriglobales bacterium]|nr:helix-turn-helix transcriptional regulator [Terriglobales bacterium]
MKRTDEDKEFGAEFAKRLRPFYEKALADGGTEKEFARRLGVDRGGIQRYLSKNAMPSFRTIVFAYREFGIAIPYAGTDPARMVTGRSKRRRKPSELQMDLPLTIEAPHGEINVVIKRRSPQRIRLQLRALKIG